MSSRNSGKLLQEKVKSRLLFINVVTFKKETFASGFLALFAKISTAEVYFRKFLSKLVLTPGLKDIAIETRSVED